MWDDLPDHAQKNFDSIGLTKSIFNGQDTTHPIDAQRRISILNLYIKLNRAKLSKTTAWRFVNRFRHAGIGTLDFTVTSLSHFKNALNSERTFTNPAASNDSWDSRELRYRYSLHFRHNKKYQDRPEEVSAHIDPIGLYTGPGLWRKPQALLTGPLHLICYHHYRRVENIRDGLLQQGWDLTLLRGK